MDPTACARRTFVFTFARSVYMYILFPDENTGCIPCVLTEIRKQTAYIVVPYVSKHHRFSRLRLESAGNGILVPACNTETRPPPADVGINGHGRSRTDAAVWIADSDPPFRILVRLLRMRLVCSENRCGGLDRGL